MSYYREIRHDELVAWLLDRAYTNNGAVEIGVGTLATDLLERFDILGTSNTAS